MICFERKWGTIASLFPLWLIASNWLWLGLRFGYDKLVQSDLKLWKSNFSYIFFWVLFSKISKFKYLLCKWMIKYFDIRMTFLSFLGLSYVLFHFFTLENWCIRFFFLFLLLEQIIIEITRLNIAIITINVTFESNIMWLIQKNSKTNNLTMLIQFHYRLG